MNRCFDWAFNRPDWQISIGVVVVFVIGIPSGALLLRWVIGVLT